MKKLFIMLMACLFSLGVFADSETCRVYGSKTNNVVTVKTPVVTNKTVSEYQTPTIFVELGSTQAEEAIVVVHVYLGNKLVSTETVTVTNKRWRGEIVVPERKQTYFIKIASASCVE